MNETASVRISTFQGLQNLPIIAAIRQGYIHEANLEIELSMTNSSAQQLASLARGEIDLAHTAPDNVINFDTNPEAFGVDVESAPRIVMLLGGSNGPISVYSQPHLTSIAQLRGSRVGVDNPVSGFALVLRDLLARGGLEHERDYTFVMAGGTGKRADALLEGVIASTALYPPFDIAASKAGCQQLASSTLAYPAYASQSLAAREAWARANNEVITRYCVAFLKALRWIYTPESRPEVERLLAEEPALGVMTTGNSGLVTAAEAYEAFTDAQRGYGREARLDEAGLRQVIDLRAQYAAPTRSLGEPADYCDLRWYHEALNALDV